MNQAEEERIQQYIEFFGLTRCQFDDECDQCEKATGGSWASLSHIPEQGVEADYYICGDCIKAQSALGWCKTCGYVSGDGQISEVCKNCCHWHREQFPDLYKVFGPEKCPRPCVECPDGDHHWLDHFDDEHEAFTKYGLLMWFACKHCEAWTPEVFIPDESLCQSCECSSDEWSKCRDCGIIICKTCDEKHVCRCVPF